MAMEIQFSRLPVGHTHEDIDAVFGTIGTCCREKISRTFEEFDENVMSAFRNEGLIVDEIHSVMVVPNYRQIFDDMESRNELIVPTLLHREKDTKHTWKFLAVQPHPIYFPLGVKVVYKAYCSNEVIEFEEKPKEFCTTSIGTYTGLEPYTYVSTWEPEPFGLNSLPGREGVEGYYFIKKPPSCLDESGIFPLISPRPCKPGICADMVKTMASIRAKFPFTSDERKFWEEWWATYGVQNVDFENSSTYLEHVRSKGLDMRCPLGSLLFNPDEIVTPEEKYTLLSFNKGTPYHHSIHSNYSNFIDGIFLNNFYTYSIISYNHITVHDQPLLQYMTISYTGYTHSLGDKIDPGFIWPDALCAAMNSVRAEYFGANALPSRLHAVNAAQLKERVTKYLQDIGDYFLLLSAGRNTNQRAVLSNEKLEEIIRRLVGYSGEQLSHTGNGCY